MERDATADVDTHDSRLAEMIVAALAQRRLTLDDLLAAVMLDEDDPVFFVPTPRAAPEQRAV